MATKCRATSSVYLRASLWLLAAWLAWSALAASDPLDSLFDDPVIVQGKGVRVTRSEFEDAFTAYKANLSAQGRSIPESQRPLQERQLLDRLIITQLLVGHATEADRAKAKEKADTLRIDAQNAASSDEMFVRQLKALGLSVEEFNQRVSEQALAQAVLERELQSPITIPDRQVEEFYETGTDVRVLVAEEKLAQLAADPKISQAKLDEAKARISQLRELNLKRLVQPDQVHLSHILVATEDRATGKPLPPEKVKAKRALIEQLLRRARAGEDFSQLIAQYSEDRRVQETHGEYTFTRFAPLAPEFKAAAFSLRPGQISDVVSTSYGFHIIKLLSYTPSKKVDLKEAFEEIRSFLAEQEMQKRLPGYCARLKKEADVKILDPKYDVPLPEELTPLPLTD